METPMLSVRSLHCGYDGPEILHGLSFDVHSHEKLCVLGPNGCGKTTLLRALAGMLPFSGQVRACGLDVRTAKRAAVARAVGLMSQISSVYFSYTVYETVLLGRYAHQKGGFSAAFSPADGTDRAVVEESLRRTGTWQLRDRQINELSGGQLQRVFLARTFAQSPHIILLDEPTNHLDLKYQLELMQYLREWAAEEDRCVVGVLHDINLALSFADTLMLLEDGACVCSGPAAGFDLHRLNDVYGLDVAGYMRGALSRWQTGPEQKIQGV